MLQLGLPEVSNQRYFASRGHHIAFGRAGAVDPTQGVSGDRHVAQEFAAAVQPTQLIVGYGSEAFNCAAIWALPKVTISL
jgi:hypothetical protein